MGSGDTRSRRVTFCHEFGFEARACERGGRARSESAFTLALFEVGRGLPGLGQIGAWPAAILGHGNRGKGQGGGNRVPETEPDRSNE